MIKYVEDFDYAPKLQLLHEINLLTKTKGWTLLL